MPSVTLTCLRQDQIDAATGSTYPLYCGFSTPDILNSVASAPAFTDHTPHHTIASNVQKTPVQDWQRPLNAGRVTRIAMVFDDHSKIMPNPVLLAEDVTLSGLVQASPTVTPGGQQTGIYEIKLATTSPAHPLWILDGQHRIHGLAASTRRHDPLPFVLLVRDGAMSYTAAQFAEIFAQVTTEAEDLKAEHREWLSYAFSLGSYSSAKADADQQRDAFATAVDLCSRAASAGDPRPFFNAVRFNPSPALPASASSGGFGKTCQDLAKLLRSGYYGQPSTGVHLPPQQLAAQISKAYVALHGKIVNPTTSVFFSSDKHELRVMQDAFLWGVLAFLRTHGVPGPGAPVSDWDTLLDQLKFSSTPWDFSPWVRALSGKAQTDSQQIAKAVFVELFRKASLPTPAVQGGTSPNIVDILKGAGGVIGVDASKLTQNGRRSSVGRTTHAFALSGSGSVNFSSRQEHLQVSALSANVARIELEVASSAGAIPKRLQKRWLDPSVASPPFSLFVRSYLFGGTETVLDLSVT